MTAEVDASAEVSQVQEKRALDLSAYEDLPKGGAHDCNGISHLDDNEIDRDEAYGSYVMVNGCDAVAEDPVQVDLNGEGELECFGNGGIEIDSEFEVAEPKIENGNFSKSCVSEEIGEAGQTAGEDLGERASDWLMSEFEVRDNASDGDQKEEVKKELESSEKAEEIIKAQDAVCEASDFNSKDPQANWEEHKDENEKRLDSKGTDGEFEEPKISIMYTDIIVADQNGDALDKADNGNKLNPSPDANDEGAAYDKNNLILEENHLGLNGDPVVGQSGEKEDDLDQHLVIASADEVNNPIERDNIDHSISNGNGDCLVAGEDQDGDTQTAEYVNSVNKSDDCETVLCESCASLVVSDTNTDIIVGGPSEDHALGQDKSSVKSPEIYTCLAEDIDAQAESSISVEKGDGLLTSPHEDKSSNTSPSEDHALVQDKSPEKSPELYSCLAEDIDAQAESSVSVEKEDGPLTSPDEDKSSNTSIADDWVLGSQNILEEKRQLENTESTPSAVMVGTVVINCTEMFPSLPFNNAVIKSFLKEKSPASQQLSSPVVENVRLDKDAKNVPESIDNPDSSCLLGTNVESKSENGSVEEDTQSNILGDDEGNLNRVSDVIEVESNGSTCKEVKVVDGIHRDDSSSTLEDSTLVMPEAQNVVAEVGSGPFYFVRIPRYEDDIIREKIKHAQSLVDEKTRIRDSFQAQIQTTKVTYKEFGDNLDAAKSEGRAAQNLLKTKRKEIDSAQSVINKAKNAISIDDIGTRINELERTIAHETLPLKEEKQLVRDIKQWKQLRDQLSLDVGKQAELQLALDQKEEVEERLTLLWKEMDLVKGNVLKANAVTTTVKKVYDGEREKFNGLQAQFEAANKIRQEAYASLQHVKQPYKEKQWFFGKYKNDIEEAKTLALNKDRLKLQRHAINQVETFMQRWINDEQFRKDYMRCNTRSTLRRLGTFDGRSLGPDEEPPAIDNIGKGRATSNKSVSFASTMEQDKLVVHVEDVKDNLKPSKVEGKKNGNSKTKNLVAVVPTSPNDQITVSGAIELVGTRDSSGAEVVDTIEEDKRSKEEDELAKRAEELRKEEEAIRLKEHLKLEEKAKAKEALERKKRLAEKAQARAALKAQKEAEEREKEKEKKAMRKERKKTVGRETRSHSIEEEAAVSMKLPTESQNDTEIAEKPNATLKKSQKRPQYTKQNKAKSIPPAILKRGKRKMETWMWILLTVAIVLALFFIGNGSSLGKLGMGKFSFKI